MGKPTKKQLRKYFDDLSDAYEKLSQIRSAKIKDIYDEYSKEILIICPTFEYPDWDYVTVGTFLDDIGEKDIDFGEDEDV
jgi:hypothetical protein